MALISPLVTFAFTPVCALRNPAPAWHPYGTMQGGCHRHGGPLSRKDNGESGLRTLGWSWGKIVGRQTWCDLLLAFNPSTLEGGEVSWGSRHFQGRVYCYRPCMKGRGSKGRVREDTGAPVTLSSSAITSPTP